MHSLSPLSLTGEMLLRATGTCEQVYDVPHPLWPTGVSGALVHLPGPQHPHGHWVPGPRMSCCQPLFSGNSTASPPPLRCTPRAQFLAWPCPLQPPGSERGVPPCTAPTQLHRTLRDNALLPWVGRIISHHLLSLPLPSAALSPSSPWPSQPQPGPGPPGHSRPGPS